ncbi:MAG: cytochrome c [Pyrinomonadaceae bacterium]|nr:cytochrome c [Pyrinomonadaceae bacterium]
MTFQGKNVLRFAVLVFCVSFFLVGTACRYDMQDQPRYKAYKESEFFSDGKAMRDFPEGTVARGQLNENKALHTGKKENADPNAQVETTTDELGNTIVSSFPNAIEKMPINVTKETLDRGEQRYKIFCMVCHGPVGKGDGMVVRRGYPQPTTYHDDRLRNAPVGHFFDVITNGWGKMNGYASQIPVEDRWAIVAYIRALQVSQNPEIKSGEADSTDKAAEDNKNETEQTGEAETQEPAADNGGAN